MKQAQSDVYQDPKNRLQSDNSQVILDEKSENNTISPSKTIYDSSSSSSDSSDDVKSQFGIENETVATRKGYTEKILEKYRMRHKIRTALQKKVEEEQLYKTYYRDDSDCCGHNEGNERPKQSAANDKLQYMKNYSIQFEIPSSKIEECKFYMRDQRYTFQLQLNIIPGLNDSPESLKEHAEDVKGADLFMLEQFTPENGTLDKSFEDSSLI